MDSLTDLSIDLSFQDPEDVMAQAEAARAPSVGARPDSTPGHPSTAQNQDIATGIPVEESGVSETTGAGMGILVGPLAQPVYPSPPLLAGGGGTVVATPSVVAGSVVTPSAHLSQRQHTHTFDRSNAARRA